MSTSAADKQEAGRLLGLLSGRKKTLLPADFMALVIDRVGGAGALADIVADILKNPAVAAVAKQRTLSDLARMMQHVELKSGPQGDLSQFQTGDLVGMLEEAVAGLKNANGQEAGPPTQAAE